MNIKLLLSIIGIIIGFALGPLIYFYIFPGVLRKNKYLKTQWKKPKTIGDALKMIRKIKTMFPIFGIVYQSGDISGQAKQMGYNLTVEEIQEIATFLDDTHDCNFGITWEHIQQAIEKIMNNIVEAEIICGFCNGSGEGMHDGTTCMHCKGSGVEQEEKYE